jgi:hypothetical protein
MNENQSANMKLKMKKGQIRKIQTMTKSTRSASIAYSKMDFYEERIYLMKSQEMKNLNHLDSSDILLNSSFSSEN